MAKVKSEKEFRKSLLTMATNYGCKNEFLELINKWDRIINNCPNDVERDHMKNVAIVEIHRFFGCVGSLVVDGKEVLPPSEDDYDDSIYLMDKVVKLD